MQITELEWHEDLIFHVARHRVIPEEVEQVVFSSSSRVEKGRGEHVYYLTGQTEGGRYLMIVLRYLGHGKARVITARDADGREKKRYQERRG